MQKYEWRSEKPLGWILFQEGLSVAAALSKLTELIFYSHVMYFIIFVKLWVWVFLITHENAEKSQLAKGGQDNNFI